MDAARTAGSGASSRARSAIFAAAGVALVTLAGCGGGRSPSPTPSPTAPADFLDFAGRIDRALTLDDVDLLKFTKFGAWSCPNNYFPAPGPDCEESAQGEGVDAIDIGAYQSEGQIYDEPSLGRYFTDWIYEALRDASDDFGGGAPRVYAIADMPPESEGFQGELGAYEIIATRIAESPVKGSAQREVLTVFVAGTTQGWLITKLLESPVDFLDPETAEARAAFVSWQRWTRPAPTGELADRWKPDRGGRELAYLDSSGTLFVASANGASTRTTAQGVCGGTTGGKNDLNWSADGRFIAVRCAGSGQGKWSVEVYPSDGGSLSGVIENVSNYVWSPHEHRIAYQTLDAAVGLLTAAVRLRDPDTDEDTLLHDNAILLDWPGPDELLLGLNPVSRSGVYFETYEAHFYNLATGTTARVERFDDQAQFWIAPPGDKAIVLGGPVTRKDGPGVQLSVYDIATGEETPLAGLAIAYGSSGIPRGSIVVSPAGDRFVWADYGVGGVTISQSALDGSHATRLDVLKGDIFSISADGIVLYSAGPNGPSGLTVRDLLTGAETDWPEAATGATAPKAGQS